MTKREMVNVKYGIWQRRIGCQAVGKTMERMETAWVEYARFDIG